jgi:glutathione S-transferase
MKLYYAPGACSLADHIALIEGGFEFERERVDLKSKRTETGADFAAINHKGYVPALQFDDGEVLTENLAVLDWIAEGAPELAPEGPLGRTRLLEALAFISTEIHKGYKPLFVRGSEAEKAAARAAIANRYRLLADRMKGPFLLGGRPTVADYYLFVTLLWATKFEVEVPVALGELLDRLLERPAVQAAMEYEGLLRSAPPERRTRIA